MPTGEFLMRKPTLEKDLTPGVARLLEIVRKIPGSTSDFYAQQTGWTTLTINSFIGQLISANLITASNDHNERYHPVLAPQKPPAPPITPETIQDTSHAGEAVAAAICGPAFPIDLDADTDQE